jgi:primary-amine oxidase
MFNTAEKNAFGEHRGWRFMPGRGSGMHLVIQNSENLHKSMAFATHDFYVTKYKADEEWSAHSSNSYDTRNPVVNFGEYFDGESLVDEDLVLWYNLGSKWGALRMPLGAINPRLCSTDSVTPHSASCTPCWRRPHDCADYSTSFHDFQSCTFLSSGQVCCHADLDAPRQHNWLESDPSRQSRQAVRIDYNSSNPEIVENVLTFGAAELSGTLDLGAYQPDYMKYTGDSNIRKLPYDPLNPYNDTVSI